MSPTLGDALHELAGDVGDLGDIERALRDVRSRRIRIAVGGGVATCLAVVLAALAVPTPASVEPAGPEPVPAVEVIDPTDGPLPSIVTSPLPKGADVAAAANGRAVVWARGSARLVASSPRLHWTSLSPDGRLLARSDGGRDLQQTAASGTGGGDELVVTDLTTGRDLLRWQMQVDGEAGQAPRYVWSGDSQRLFVTVIPTNGGIYEYPPSLGELHAWERSADGMSEVGRARPLPGMVVGADESGQTVLVQDGDQLARLDPATGDLTRTGVGFIGDDGSGGPPSPWGRQHGQGCWDTSRNRVCLVTLPAGGSGPVTVTWVDAAAGASEPPRSYEQLTGYTQFAGWLDGDPVVLSSDGPDRVLLARLTEAGSVVLRQFDTSRPSGGLEWNYTVSVPAYR